MSVCICNVHTNSSQKELTSHGNSLFPMACYEDNLQLMSVPLHWHEEFEFIVATEGTLSIHIGTEQLSVSKGNAVFINSGYLHCVELMGDDPGVLRSLVIHPRLIGGNFDSFFWQKIVIPFSGNPNLSYIFLDNTQTWHSIVIKSMMDAWNAVVSETYDYENYSRYLVSKAFHILKDQGIAIGSATNNNSLTNIRMKQLIQYIDAHYMEDISTQMLMEQINASESVLLRCFKQTVGTSPMRFLLDYRIEKAAILLISTDKKSCDIAAECGFNDFSYFTKTFHKKMGKTPVEYRKANAK